MNKKARRLLLSMLIGDGYVQPKGYAVIKHAERYLDYVQWKWNLLKEAGYSLSEIKQIENNGFQAWSFGVRVTSVSRRYRRFLYKSGEHNWYYRSLLNKLDALHLAILYMDDGGLAQKKREGRVVANELMLNTHTSRENNQVVIDYFLEVWGIRFSQVKNRGSYRLRCGTSEARKFLDIVRPFVQQVPSMSHKLLIKPEPNSTKDLE